MGGDVVPLRHEKPAENDDLGQTPRAGVPCEVQARKWGDMINGQSSQVDEVVLGLASTVEIQRIPPETRYEVELTERWRVSKCKILYTSANQYLKDAYGSGAEINILHNTRMPARNNTLSRKHDKSYHGINPV